MWGMGVFGNPVFLFNFAVNQKLLEKTSIKKKITFSFMLLEEIVSL